MTTSVTLKLSQEVQQKIADQARQRKMTVPDYLEDIVSEIAHTAGHSPLREKNRQALELLESLDNATPAEIAEQRETWKLIEGGIPRMQLREGEND